MPTLKELKQRARSEGIVGFSRMKKADLEKALQNLQRKRIAQKTSFPVVKSLVEKVLPQRISKVVESSIDSMNDWFGKMKKRVDWNLKENARKKLLKLNSKIGEMLKRPEFEIQEKPGLGGSTFIVKGKEGYSAEGFLKNLKPQILEILQKHSGYKVQITLVARMVSSNLAQGTEIEDTAFFSSLAEEVFEGTDFERLINNIFTRILENMRNFQRGRSNWRKS